jgi:hypothetical protein
MTRARDVSNTINTSNFAAKNWFLNGACEFWQRGTSYSGAQTNLYLMDRWLGINVSSVSRSTDVPTETNFQYSISFGHSTASYPLICYRMPSEESRFLAGKVVTLSFWAKNVTGTAVLYGEMLTPSANNNFGTLTNLGAVGVFSFAPASSWVRYSSTFTVTADSLRGLEFRIVRDAASAATTLVTGMQLEIGRAVTGFQRRSGDYSAELTSCQRYYENNYPDGYFPGSDINAIMDINQCLHATVATGGTAGTHRARSARDSFATTKRVKPSIRFWDKLGNLDKYTGGDVNGSGLSHNNAVDGFGGCNSTNKSIYFQSVAASASHIYQTVMWEASAEL